MGRDRKILKKSLALEAPLVLAPARVVWELAGGGNGRAVCVRLSSAMVTALPGTLKESYAPMNSTKCDACLMLPHRDKDFSLWNIRIFRSNGNSTTKTLENFLNSQEM